jgi:hypothetical protein
MGSVFLEVKPGPYTSYATEDRAPWAPAEGSFGVADYLARIESQVKAKPD